MPISLTAPRTSTHIFHIIVWNAKDLSVQFFIIFKGLFFGDFDKEECDRYFKRVRAVQVSGMNWIFITKLSSFS